MVERAKNTGEKRIVIVRVLMYLLRSYKIFLKILRLFFIEIMECFFCFWMLVCFIIFLKIILFLIIVECVNVYWIFGVLG